MQMRTIAGVAPLLVLMGAGLGGACSRSAAPAVRGKFGAEEWKRSAIPVRPGEPGKAPFWNVYAKRFIYAPAFDFKRIENAVKYRFEITSLKDSSAWRFESKVPWAPLSPVWASVPAGHFHLKVTGLSAKGESLGVAGEGRYFRAGPFDGPYHEPVIPYDKSAMLALEKFIEKPYVAYWLTHKAPDPDYALYRYSAKMFGSLVVGGVAYARMKPGTEEARRATELARIVADYLIGITFPAGAPLEYFPPVYHGKWVGTPPHAQVQNYMTIIAADSGHAYLDLYDHTRDSKYLEAAKRIARTYLKTQGEDGTWYLYVNTQTGAPIAEHKAIPTSTINYLERLKKDYGMEGLEGPIQRAFDWIMKNPVKTFHWLSQYEDVDNRHFDTYEKMSREQTCDLAIYLFKNRARQPEYVELGEELIRFAEDQFLTWEEQEDLAIIKSQTVRPAPESSKNGGAYSRNWMSPTVHEQYGFWMPSARNTGLMIETYWYAYAATKKEVYLAKARSIANNFTRVQAVHDGEYPTFFTKYPQPLWINNSIYPAKVMATFHENLKTVR